MSTQKFFNMHQIGSVRSKVTAPVDEGWGDVVSEIRLEPQYKGALTGLENFSHALIVYFLHLAIFDAATDLIRKPQGRADMPEVGIFSQRAKHRPNPIGVTAVEILAVSETMLKVKGLDAIDGTPVLDIKPYYPIYDKKDAKTPAWVDRLLQEYF